nr:hypothetical protein [Tanacetum cinerariifolium]
MTLSSYLFCTYEPRVDKETESTESEDEDIDLEDEETTSEGQQDNVPSTFQLGQSSMSTPDQQLETMGETPTQTNARLPIRTTWEDPDDSTIYTDFEYNMPLVCEKGLLGGVSSGKFALVGEGENFLGCKTNKGVLFILVVTLSLQALMKLRTNLKGLAEGWLLWPTAEFFSRGLSWLAADFSGYGLAWPAARFGVVGPWGHFGPKMLNVNL